MPRTFRGRQVVDQYERNLEELFLLRNPRCRFDKNYAQALAAFKKTHFGKRPPKAAGRWFYYPWSETLVHFLPEKLHFELRTGRNKNLITGEEQKKYYRACIGIAGLSVGSHIALTVAMTGGASRIKLADPDALSGDNLNRIRTGFQNVGVSKAVAVARQIFEINPYARVELYPKGLSDANLKKFLQGLDLFVEVMDNPYLKLASRYEARRRGIPVVMGTDNGDNIIVDVERFDLKRNYPVLHGLAGNLKLQDLRALSPRDLPKIAAKIAGANLATPRMLASVAEVGTSLYSWPQLGTAANLCGSAVAYLVRRIVLKDRAIASGRYEVNLDSIFESDYARKKNVRQRAFKAFVKRMRE
jgi:molybdopterin/thiamine biosynthesis adenylyltransferase